MKFAEEVNEWTRDEMARPTGTMPSVLAQFFHRMLYDDYEPCNGAEGQAFRSRLEAWVSSAPDAESRRKLLLLLDKLYFVGREEMRTSYELAYRRISWQWLLSVGKATPDDAEAKLQSMLETTWFCPITDSMQISLFYHINGLSGDYRPDWRSLMKFGDRERIRAHVQQVGIQQIILLEDFVGTGNQVAATIAFAADTFQELKVLCIPLFACQEGVTKLQEQSTTRPNLEVLPVAVLDDASHIRASDPLEPNDFSNLLRQLHPLVESNSTAGDSGLSPFGYGELGPLFSMYTNCPNNAPPIFHTESPLWKPIFPRVVRA